MYTMPWHESLEITQVSHPIMVYFLHHVYTSSVDSFYLNYLYVRWLLYERTSYTYTCHVMCSHPFTLLQDPGLTLHCTVSLPISNTTATTVLSIPADRANISRAPAQEANCVRTSEAGRLLNRATRMQTSWVWRSAMFFTHAAGHNF